MGIYELTYSLYHPGGEVSDEYFPSVINGMGLWNTVNPQKLVTK